jgi:hypothetical protein
MSLHPDAAKSLYAASRLAGHRSAFVLLEGDGQYLVHGLGQVEVHRLPRNAKTAGSGGGGESNPPSAVKRCTGFEELGCRPAQVYGGAPKPPGQVHRPVGEGLTREGAALILATRAHACTHPFLAADEEKVRLSLEESCRLPAFPRAFARRADNN